MTLKEIIGHRRPIKMLQKAILNDRLPHAYLFLGPEGTGRRLTALALAKALNCENGIDDCCEKCLSCRKIQASNHPDVSVIYPDGQYIRIDTIRQLRRSLSYRPYEGKRRICILDGADRMKPEGANALLKTLEEPPPDTLLILLATERGLLLPTVVSRCQQVRFCALPTDQMIEALTKRLSIEKGEARAVAVLSQGSLGRALELVNHEVWQKRRGIVHDLMELPCHGVGRAFAIAESLANMGEDLPLVFLIMISWYRDLILWKEQKDVSRLIHQDLCDEVSEGAVSMSRRSLIRRIEAINRVSKVLNLNANRLLAMESLVLQLK
jgi:DNA polymerase-3 subunit delta'